MRWRIPCTGKRARCEHCRRNGQALGMLGDAYGLVFIFNIFPLIPAAVHAADDLYGSSGAWCTAWLLYVGYPVVLGGAMWLNWPHIPAGNAAKEEGKEATEWDRK